MRTLSKASLALSLTLSFSAFAQQADLVLLNGNIITMNEQQPRATALAVVDNKIVAIGNEQNVKNQIGEKTQVIDLQNKTVIPGLIDAHLHGIRGGRSYLFETYWYDVKNIAEGLQRLQQSAKNRSSEQWVTVVGSWIPEQMAENRSPTVEELSQAVPAHPAYVQSLYDFALLNQKGIEALALNSDKPKLPRGIKVERDENGKATGKLLGTIGSYNQLFAQISHGIDVKKNLAAFLDDLNSRGVTGFIDPSAGGDDAYQTIFELQQELPQNQMRIAYRLSSTPGNEVEWFQQRLAYHPPYFERNNVVFLGLGENLVMAMNDGVYHGKGFNSHQAEQDKMLQILRLAAQRKTSVELHSYTDDSASDLLDVLEKVNKEYNIKDLRWSIAHLNTGSEHTLDRMKALGLAYSVQMGPYFESPAIAKANNQHAAEHSSPIKKALQKGIVVAGGTDATRIGVAGVWQAIEYHVTGLSLGKHTQKPVENLLSPEQALQLYTKNAAWLMKDDLRGSLAVGKIADFAVLNQDILTAPKDQLHKTKAELTFVSGKQVYPKISKN